MYYATSTPESRFQAGDYLMHMISTTTTLYRAQEVGGTLIGENGLVVMAGVELVKLYQMHQTHSFHLFDSILFTLF